MSTMPGASARPSASTRARAAPRSAPTATMRPSFTATPPACPGPPSPSKTLAPSITRSCTTLTLVVGIRPLHLEDLVDVAVEVAREPADGLELRHVEAAGGGIVHVVADVPLHDLAEDQVRLADGQDPDEPALHVDRGLGDARRLHLQARRRRQPGQRELVDFRRIVAGREV